MKRSWTGLGEALNKNPKALLYGSIWGPRWNCHAVIGTTGIFKVQSTLEVSSRTLQEASDAWTIVIYDKSNKTIGHMSSSDTNGNDDWIKKCLECGEYSLTLRYYNPGPRAGFPEVRVDNAELISSRAIGDEREIYDGFLNSIRNKNGLFFRLLHYYMFFLLEWKNVSADLIRKEFLPVGNPATQYYYGIIHKNEIMEINSELELLKDAYIYLTLYNTSSFPISWDMVETSCYKSNVMTVNGYYLIRIVNCSPERSNLLSIKIVSNKNVF
ncbi:MAG: hypothetical protein JXB88_00020 [Spirochaetales bacterium]|nr:hypothetical protein [Spirochaetales bacterium]